MNGAISKFLGVYKHYASYSQKPLFIYLCPKRFVVADFYTLSTCWELLWELNKMVLSLPAATGQQGRPPSPRRLRELQHGVSAELLLLLSLLLPPPNWHPNRSQAIQKSCPHDVQLSSRPKAMRKTKS